MEHDQAAGQGPTDTSQESFLGSFGRVPNGLDPTQVYSYFLKTSARLRQLEEQARQSSAPYVLEAALREATEARTQAAQAAERSYNDIVKAAQQEADRIRAEAEEAASAIREQARAQTAGADLEAERIRQQAREEAAQVRRQALERNEHDEQELERLCVDFANLLQRLLDRRKAVGEELTGAGAPGGDSTPAGAPDAPTGTSDAAAPGPSIGSAVVAGLAGVAAGVALGAVARREPAESSEIEDRVEAAEAPTGEPGPTVESEGLAAPGVEEVEPAEDLDVAEHAEAVAEARFDSPAPSDSWPDDWSFASPAESSDPPPPAPLQPTDAGHAHGPDERATPQNGESRPAGERGGDAREGGFRLPSWLDL